MDNRTALDYFYIRFYKGINSRDWEDDMIDSKLFETAVAAFDFARVKKAMDAIGWDYSGSPVTIEQLHNMVWTLFDGFDDWNHDEHCSTSCGGFTIEKPHGAKYIELSFCIEEHTEYEEESEVEYVQT